MQIKKHTTLTSNRFRFDRFTAKNSFVAMLRCKQASTYQPDPTDVICNPSNQLQTNDVVHGETSMDAQGKRTGRFDFQARDGQHGLRKAETFIVPHERTPVAENV
jgi:hypothetical protein